MKRLLDISSELRNLRHILLFIENFIGYISEKGMTAVEGVTERQAEFEVGKKCNVEHFRMQTGAVKCGR